MAHVTVTRRCQVWFVILRLELAIVSLLPNLKSLSPTITKLGKLWVTQGHWNWK